MSSTQSTDIAGIEFYVENSGISSLTSQLYDAADIEKFKASASKLPFLKYTETLHFKVPKLAKKLDGSYDTLIFPSYTMLPRINGEKFDSKIAVYVHDIWDFFHTESLIAKINVESAIRNLSRCDIVIANSDVTKEVLHNTVCDNKKISVVRYGVETSIFFPGRDEESPGLDLPDKYILYVGGFLERKNEKFLLDVLSNLNDFDLVIAGDCYSHKRKREFLNYASNKGLLDRITLTGWLSPEILRKVYSNASVYLHPARSGGYEMPPVEAAACGTPVVMYEHIPSANDLGKSATTFSEFDASYVANLVEESEGNNPNFKPQTWGESAEKFLSVLQSS